MDQGHPHLTVGAGRGTVDVTGHHVAGQILPFHIESDPISPQSQLGLTFAIRDHRRVLKLLTRVEAEFELEIVDSDLSPDLAHR